MAVLTKPALSLSQCGTYAVPYFVAIWLMTPMGVVQGIYAKYFGVPLTAIATVVLFSRVIDAITDPLIGTWSDRCYQRTGTRKPFVLVGGLGFVVAAYFLYVPPSDVGVVYFGVWSIVFYLAWTLFEIPHITWGSELAPGTADKTRLYSARSIAFYAGKLGFYCIPLLPIFVSSAITPETLKLSVTIAGMLMLPLLFVCLRLTPDRVDSSPAAAPAVGGWRGACEAWTAVRGNRPFLLVLLAYGLGGMGTGMWYGLAFIFVDIYLGLGELFAGMFMTAFVVGILSTPLWYRVINRFGKQRSWVGVNIVLIGSFLYTGTLVPGATGYTELLLLKICQTLGFSCMGIIVPAMVSESCDYGMWKFKVERSGTYFAVYTFTFKSTAALAGFLGLAIAGWYGFDATATTQSDSGIRGLILVMTWLPVLFTALSVVFILSNPLDARRHSVIQRRLAGCRCEEARW